jgi:hypothetical protein
MEGVPMNDTKNPQPDQQQKEKLHQQTEDILKKQAQNPNPNLPRRDAPAHQQQSGQDKPPNR